MTKKPAKASHRPGWGVVGLMAWFSLCWSWTLSTDSLSLSGSHTQGLIVAAIVSIIIVGLSTIILWQGMRLIKQLFATRPTWQAIALSLPLLALSDFLVAWLTAIIWIGPQGSVDNILPLGSPTLILINTPFGFASRIVGFFGLAAFGWLIVFLLASKTRRKLALIPLAILGMTSLVGWGIYRSASGSSFQAKLISETLSTRVPAINTADTALVIFPEYGLDGISNENLTKRIYATDQKSHFVGSQEVWPPGKSSHYNTLIFGNTEDGITQTQNKYRLIPGGEDLSYIGRIGLLAANQTELLDYFTFSKAVIRGDKQLQPLTVSDETSVGAAVCSSIISPFDYRHFARSGATVLSNSASLQIFGGTLVFNRQQKSLGRFMATANARYFLQSANGDRAYAIDHNGRTVTETGGHHTLDVTVQNNSTKTLYTRVGEWLVCIGAAVGFWLIISLRNTRRAKTEK